ncbi:MAG: four helix bundle protein [Bacteroidales bacterium]|nr:four helix bundle protein [Bacteroidales bacterium]
MTDVHTYSFEHLQMFQTARTLAKDVYQILPYYPKFEQYALCDQLRRASISISSNIAEGSSRSSAKEQLHFIEIAHGSLMEIYAQILLSLDLNYIDLKTFDRINNLISTESKLLSGYRKSLIIKIQENSNRPH